MLKKEWETILRHKFLMVVMIALIVVPALYSGIFLASMWNPYGNVDHLPVAIVNQDKATKNLKLGHQIVGQLRNSRDLDYHFLDQTAAENGLKNGKYYLIVNIPENFSKNAESVMTTDPKQVQIDYQTSQGHNYISSKMANTSVELLKTKVAQEITEKYTQAIFDGLSKMKTKLADASVQAGKLSDGAEQAKNGSAGLSSNLTKLSQASLSFSDGQAEFSEGLQQYLNSEEQLNSGIKTISTGTAQFVTGSQKLATGTQQLSQSTNELANELSAKLPSSQEAQEFDNDSHQLLDSLSNLTTDNLKKSSVFQNLTRQEQTEIMQVLAQENAQKSDIQAKIDNLNTQYQTAIVQFDQFQNAVTQINQGAQELSGQSVKLNTGAEQLVSGSNQLTAENEKLSSGAEKLDDSSKTLSNQEKLLSDGAAKLAKGNETLANGTATFDTALKNSSSELSNLPTAVTNATALSNPVTLNHADSDHVPNNGVAMSPYMISVALFVGAVSVNIMLGTSLSQLSPNSKKEFILTKLGTNSVLAVLQALIVITISFVMGLNPNFSWKFIFGTILISLAFMAIVTFFNLWLGKIGSFVMMILLILQLSGSAGTYPIELSAKFFQIINPFLPMTYSIRMLRQSISLSGQILPYVAILLSLFLIFTILQGFTFRKVNSVENSRQI